MSESWIVGALGALAQSQRLRAFRALVMAGPQGLTPSAMAAQIGIAPNALSFHLKELARAGLVSCEPRGRNLIYRADFAVMSAVMAYLGEHCCESAACNEPAPQGCTPC